MSKEVIGSTWKILSEQEQVPGAWSWQHKCGQGMQTLICVKLT